jgi:hypothetical protein
LHKMLAAGALVTTIKKKMTLELQKNAEALRSYSARD